MQPLVPPPLTNIDLSQFDPRCVFGDWNKETAEKQIKKNTAKARDLSYRLYAENRRAVLLILQGMDASGKDGTIRTVMTGINPQTFRIVSFKAPSVEELDHDFLWRIHREIPPRGSVGIFNRSHYEDVLVVRVRNLVPEAEWSTRYDRINEFEELLSDGGVTLIKVFLHMSRDEQRERLQARIEDPTKRWKFRHGDLDERKEWDAYQAAYETVLSRCNTPHAPWHIVPADRKWHRNLVVSEVFRQTLERMAPQLPLCEPGIENVRVE